MIFDIKIRTITCYGSDSKYVFQSDPPPSYTPQRYYEQLRAHPLRPQKQNFP